MATNDKSNANGSSRTSDSMTMERKGMRASSDRNVSRSGVSQKDGEQEIMERHDVAERVLHSIDASTTRVTRVSIFHLLALASIGGSIGLFLSGRRTEGIFVGLWPPTFLALKAASERK